MRVIIAGSRQFDNYDLLCQKCNQLFMSMDNIEVLSGNSKGGDQLGEKYAVEKGYFIKLFLPEWNKYGKSAGIKRNEKMVKNADMLIAFWDGKSKGTQNVINIANKLNLKVELVYF